MASTTVHNSPIYSPRAQAALLKAANSVFSLAHTAESLDELADGVLLGHILHQLDSEFDPCHLESNTGVSKYLTGKRNIQTVYKGLFRFIRRHVPELSCQAKKFDYHVFAENPEPQGISQLLATMISAAAMGPENSKYVPRIQNGLDRESQAEIMEIIRAMQQDIVDFKDYDDRDKAIDAFTEARNIDLLVEEQNASLRQQLEGTKKNLTDYITRLEHLQQSHEELKYEKEKNDRELEVLRKAMQDGANSAEAIKILEAQVHDQMEIITRNEESIRSHDRVKAQLESEIKRLHQKSQETDDLRDQVTELKHKAEELEKKANTAERYKQKLESQQHLAREARNLEFEKAELQEQLRSLIDDRERHGRTRKAEDELTKMITQSEQHLWDERNQKNQLMKDLSNLEEELARMKAQKTHDENFIRELQEQVQQAASTAGQSGSSGALPGTISLQDELNDAANDSKHSHLPLQLSRLQAENELLKRTLGAGGSTSSLQRDLEEQRLLRDRLQQNFNIMFEKHTVAQEQINALLETSNVEGTRAFENLRTQAMKSREEIEDLNRQVDALRSNATSADRELAQAKALLMAAEKGGIAAIDELKSTDKMISKSLKAELDSLRGNYNFVVSECEAQKSQLIEALLAKEKLRKEVEDGKESPVAMITDSAHASVSETIKKSGEKIEKLRERLKERKQQIEKSEQEKLELRRQLKIAQGGASSSHDQGAAADQIIKNLRRENTLIATAWYDLSSRLQSNHVVLQRRYDAPRSWLNKQRQIVNAVPRK